MEPKNRHPTWKVRCLRYALRARVGRESRRKTGNIRLDGGTSDKFNVTLDQYLISRGVMFKGEALRRQAADTSEGAADRTRGLCAGRIRAGPYLSLFNSAAILIQGLAIAANVSRAFASGSVCANRSHSKARRRYSSLRSSAMPRIAHRGPFDAPPLEISPDLLGAAGAFVFIGDVLQGRRTKPCESGP
jgi:hypothetical protein